jgi:hypothetical protein
VSSYRRIRTSDNLSMASASDNSLFILGNYSYVSKKLVLYQLQREFYIIQALVPPFFSKKKWERGIETGSVRLSTYLYARMSVRHIMSVGGYMSCPDHIFLIHQGILKILGTNVQDVVRNTKTPSSKVRVNLFINQVLTCSQ